MTKKVKLLNLDTLAESKEELVVVLNGKEHKLKEMSVSDFIWAQKNLKDVSQGSSEEEVVKSLVAMLLRQFPTMSESELMELSASTLNQLTEFVQSVGMKGAEAAVAEAEAEAVSKGEVVTTAAAS